jgi:hypothetical protein
MLCASLTVSSVPTLGMKDNLKFVTLNDPDLPCLLSLRGTNCRTLSSVAITASPKKTINYKVKFPCRKGA